MSNDYSRRDFLATATAGVMLGFEAQWNGKSV